MLHALLYDRAMQFDKTWDSYEAPVVLGVWRNVVNCHFEVESLCMSRTLERVSVGSCKKFCWMMKSSSEPLMHVDSRRLGCSSHPIIRYPIRQIPNCFLSLSSSPLAQLDSCQSILWKFEWHDKSICHLDIQVNRDTDVRCEM